MNKKLQQEITEYSTAYLEITRHFWIGIICTYLFFLLATSNFYLALPQAETFIHTLRIITLSLLTLVCLLLRIFPMMLVEKIASRALEGYLFFFLIHESILSILALEVKSYNLNLHYLILFGTSIFVLTIGYPFFKKRTKKQTGEKLWQNLHNMNTGNYSAVAVALLITIGVFVIPYGISQYTLLDMKIAQLAACGWLSYIIGLLVAELHFIKYLSFKKQTHDSEA